MFPGDINRRDLIMLLRIYFLPYLKAGAFDLMAEDRGLLFVSKLTLFPSALCPSRRCLALVNYFSKILASLSKNCGNSHLFAM